MKKASTTSGAWRARAPSAMRSVGTSPAPRRQSIQPVHAIEQHRATAWRSDAWPRRCAHLNSARWGGSSSTQRSVPLSTRENRVQSPASSAMTRPSGFRAT
ncbi:hypothetical protein [Sorangium sp. So ce861]|uniref:hypothetical protein n=1 Tax=Sorangium sp. So ce861 TaxID=3133323 RepID=UPI003F618FE1